MTLALALLTALATQTTETSTAAFENARAEFERGIAHLDAKRWSEASIAFERSLVLRESPPALYNLAIALQNLGDNRRALATIDRYIELQQSRAPDSDQLRDARTLKAHIEQSVVAVKPPIVVPATPDEPASVLEEWWFWAAVVGAVAASVAIGVAVGSSSEPSGGTLGIVEEGLRSR